MTTTRDIFIGVDAGATKTKVVIEDNLENFLGEACVGAATIRFDTKKAWQTILNAINKALSTKGINLEDKSLRFHAGMGLTGCEIEECYQEFINTKHPFQTLVVKQDSYTACLGAHAGCDGAIIIVGTGVSGVEIQGEKIIQVSGFGFPHDDQGSGAWLGLKAISFTFMWLDGRMDSDSKLLDDIFQKFDRSLPKLITWANAAKPTQFAEIAPLVLAYIPKEDPIAMNLIKRAAKHVDAVAAALVKRSENNVTLPCALFGGVAPFVEPWLDVNLKARLVPPKYDAAKGAILMLKKYMQKEQGKQK